MVLIIDDDKAVRVSLKFLLKQNNYQAVAVSGPEEALDWMRTNTPSLVLMDMNFSLDTSGREGIELLRKTRIFHPEVPVILITGWGSIELAVQGMKNGASDFITKPWNNQTLLDSVKTNLLLSEESPEEYDNRKELGQQYDFSGIIGRNGELLKVLNMVGRISKTDATVLITGESGTGKELIAEAIHKNSHRNDKPFVKVNLGGISSSLFESEMFGHKKGAFTDAKEDRQGRFEIADEGTIFLDEIGELDHASQVKLLRVLQEKQYESLGESKTKKVDVRVICATNKNLMELVNKGAFREDLYYRINLINIRLPALRERTEDVPVLAESFAKTTSSENDLPLKTISKEAKKYLKELNYPGNIRELKNMVERTVLLSPNDELEKEDFMDYHQDSPGEINYTNRPGLQTIDEMEKQLIEETMSFYKGNLSKVARSLGLSRGALYRRLEKHDIRYES
jgi:DNA-binding NtrC family response regulator